MSRLKVGDMVYVDYPQWSCNSIGEITQVEHYESPVDEDEYFVECSCDTMHGMWLLYSDVRGVDEDDYINDFREKIRDRLS